MYLNANDHDNDTGSSYERDVTTYVETSDNNGTFELTMDEWTIEDAARGLADVSRYGHILYSTLVHLSKLLLVTITNIFSQIRHLN